MLSCLPRAAQLSLGVSFLYATASVSLSMLNKALLSSYGFEGYFTLLLCQLVVSYFFCVITRDHLGNPFNIPQFDMALVKAAVPMGVTSVLNVGCGLLALQLVNVPMFFCLRRLVAPCVLIYEYMAYNRVADVGVRASVGIIVIGAIVAGWDTLNDDLFGYTLTVINNLLTAASSVMQKQYSEKTKVSAIGIVYINAMVSAPLTLVLALGTGEASKVLAFPHLHDAKFQFGFMISCVMGLLLTYSSILCTTYNSPLATSVTGNAKDIATTAIGWLVFTGFKATLKSVGGILISFMGAFLYSYVGLRKSWATAASAAAAAGAGGGGGGSGVVGGSAIGAGGKAVTPSIAGAALPADAGGRLIGSDIEEGAVADIAEAGAAAGVKKGAGPGEAQARHRGGETGQRSPREVSVGADVEAAHLLAGVSGGALAAAGSAGSTGAAGVHAPISYAEWQATGGYREGGSLSGRT